LTLHLTVRKGTCGGEKFALFFSPRPAMGLIQERKRKEKKRNKTKGNETKKKERDGMKGNERKRKEKEGK